MAGKEAGWGETQVWEGADRVGAGAQGAGHTRQEEPALEKGVVGGGSDRTAEEHGCGDAQKQELGKEKANGYRSGGGDGGRRRVGCVGWGMRHMGKTDLLTQNIWKRRTIEGDGNQDRNDLLEPVPVTSASQPLLIVLHAPNTYPGPGSVQGCGKQRGNFSAPVHQALPGWECLQSSIALLIHSIGESRSL